MHFLKEYGNTEGPLGFPMLDRCARQLETLLKTLPKDKEYAYRKVTTVRAPTELNPGERSDVSWITTQAVDRVGEVVLAKGMNDSQFQANPLVPLNHNYGLPPVGKSLWRKKVKDGDMTGIKAKTRYPERPDGWEQGKSWPPDQAFALVQAGLLQGKSIGFLPLKVHFADQKEADKQGYPEGALVHDDWLLLEYSCVFLPCNQEALVEAFSKGVQIPEEFDFWKSTGLDPELVQQQIVLKQAPTPAGSRIIAFTALSEIRRAVEEACAALNIEELVQKVVQEAYDRARGRV